MGQKVHPVGLRLGINQTWRSTWFADRKYQEQLLEDLRIREYLAQTLAEGMVSRVDISRRADRVNITVHTAKPGVVIGQRGRQVEQLQNELKALTQKEVQINVQEIRYPETEAQLVAMSVASQMERRVAFRRAMRQAATKAMTSHSGLAQGIKIICGGRLGGNELARRETVKEGKIPLHTLRSDIDYGFAEAETVSGNIGVRVWIYKGDILPERKKELPITTAEPTVAAQVTLSGGTEVTREVVVPQGSVEPSAQQLSPTPVSLKEESRHHADAAEV